MAGRLTSRSASGSDVAAACRLVALFHLPSIADDLSVLYIDKVISRSARSCRSKPFVHCRIDQRLMYKQSAAAGRVAGRQSPFTACSELWNWKVYLWIYYMHHRWAHWVLASSQQRSQRRLLLIVNDGHLSMTLSFSSEKYVILLCFWFTTTGVICFGIQTFAS